MDVPRFDEKFSAFFEGTSFESMSSFDMTVPDLHFDDQPATLGTWEVDQSLNEGWQPEANLETSIDPALLTTFDTSVDLFTGFDPTATTFWDASTGSEWQPLNTETSIHPTFINPFNTAIDPFPVQVSFAKGDVVFPSQSIEFSASSAHAPFSPEVPHTRHQFLNQASKPMVSTAAKPTVEQATAGRKVVAWISPFDQPRVNGSGCPCSLCHGGPVDFGALQKPRKSAKVPKTRGRPPKGKAAKRKARELTPEDDGEDSDSSLSSVPDLDDSSPDAEDRALSDYEEPTRKAIKPTGGRGTKRKRVAWAAPVLDDSVSSDTEDLALSDYEAPRKATRATRKPAPKRRRVTRAAARPSKVGRGLEIDMNRW